MDIHITINGEIIDLQGFFKEESKLYIKFYTMYQAKVEATELLNLIQQNIDMLMENDELYKVLNDFYERLSIEQHVIDPPNDLTWYEKHPTLKDEFISAREAARRKKTSHNTIIEAIKNGKIAAHKVKSGKLVAKTEPEGRWKISAKSVEQYKVNTINQKNRSNNK
jgi:hypothetical protein